MDFDQQNIMKDSPLYSSLKEIVGVGEANTVILQSLNTHIENRKMVSSVMSRVNKDRGDVYAVCNLNNVSSVLNALEEFSKEGSWSISVHSFSFRTDHKTELAFVIRCYSGLGDIHIAESRYLASGEDVYSKMLDLVLTSTPPRGKVVCVGQEVCEMCVAKIKENARLFVGLSDQSPWNSETFVFNSVIVREWK